VGARHRLVEPAGGPGDVLAPVTPLRWDEVVQEPAADAFGNLLHAPDGGWLAEWAGWERSWTAGVIPDAELGLTEFRGTISGPLPALPVELRMGSESIFTDGPSHPELPPRLQSGWIEFATRLPVGAAEIEAAVRPGLYGEIDAIRRETFRMAAHVQCEIPWDWDERLVIGAAWLPREDLPVLPIAGVRWRVDDDTICDLVFPSPRLARRLGTTARADWWLTFGAELGGNSYATERRDGSYDVDTLRDVRLLLGVESRRAIGAVIRFEAAWVTARKLHSARSGSIDLGDAVLLQAGLQF
jgi:hypothetical protein